MICKHDHGDALLADFFGEVSERGSRITEKIVTGRRVIMEIDLVPRCTWRRFSAKLINELLDDGHRLPALGNGIYGIGEAVVYCLGELITPPVPAADVPRRP